MQNTTAEVGDGLEVFTNTNCIKLVAKETGV